MTSSGFPFSLGRSTVQNQVLRQAGFGVGSVTHQDPDPDRTFSLAGSTIEIRCVGHFRNLRLHANGLWIMPATFQLG